jgi:K+-sensing histidine kinase KdpD
MASVIALRRAQPSPELVARDWTNRAGTPAQSPRTGVIACLTARNSCNAELLRKAQRAAREDDGEFYAVLVDSPRTRFGKVQAEALLDDVILASYFGAKIVWLKSSDAVGELIQFARKTHTGRVFVSRSNPHPFFRPLGHTVYSDLLNRAEGLRIDVVGFDRAT